MYVYFFKGVPMQKKIASSNMYNYVKLCFIYEESEKGINIIK